MEDSQIIALYWERKEEAVQATAVKYGRYCHTIAYNILQNNEDADESVNDTYMAAWRSIPPHRPTVLSTFLGKLTRRISLNRWRDRSRMKRGGGEVLLALEELSGSIPSRENPEREVEMKELAQGIDRFLGTLQPVERDMFVGRYWFFAGVKEISMRFGCSESKTKSALFRIRSKLMDYLERDGLI